jgi:hypothetical protein
MVVQSTEVKSMKEFTKRSDARLEEQFLSITAPTSTALRGAAASPNRALIAVEGKYITIANPYHYNIPLDFIWDINVFKYGTCTALSNQNVVLTCSTLSGTIYVDTYAADDTTCAGFPIRTGVAKHQGMTGLGVRYFCAEDESFLKTLRHGYASSIYYPTYKDALEDNIETFQLLKVYNNIPLSFPMREKWQSKCANYLTYSSVCADSRGMRSFTYLTDVGFDSLGLVMYDGYKLHGQASKMMKVQTPNDKLAAPFGNYYVNDRVLEKSWPGRVDAAFD